MLRHSLGNSSDSKNEDGSVFSQTEHNIVAAYLILAGTTVTLAPVREAGVFQQEAEKNHILMMLHT